MYTIVLVYLIGMLISSVANMLTDVEFPQSVGEFLKLTFLPYVIINWKNLKRL